MTADEWSSNPDDWPHTPPLHVYRELEREDGNLFWRMESGHAANLLDEALEMTAEPSTCQSTTFVTDYLTDDADPVEMRCERRADHNGYHQVTQRIDNKSLVTKWFRDRSQL